VPHLHRQGGEKYWLPFKGVGCSALTRERDRQGHLYYNIPAPHFQANHQSGLCQVLVGSFPEALN